MDESYIEHSLALAHILVNLLDNAVVDQASVLLAELGHQLFHNRQVLGTPIAYVGHHLVDSRLIYSYLLGDSAITAR